MSRRTTWMFVAAGLVLAAIAVWWVVFRSGGSSSGAGSGSAGVARPVVPPPPIRSSVPIAEPDIPAGERARAERAAALLDEAIARAEEDLAAAEAAGKEIEVRDLTVDLERLRAARALRDRQLGR